ncbi:TauD/TfdA family dioxygenase [Dokdonia sp.]|uniref:TauD/TfdA family dioxygenase n=1 Tax=Dokdonia sp. TaxID=2024995 RepID=UPI0032665E1D
MTKYIYHKEILPSVLESLQRFPEEIALIEGFPSQDYVLNDFLSHIGNAVHEHLNEDSGSIFKVQVHHKEAHFSSYANSNLFFPVHTDCSNYKEIPEYVALLCVTPSIEGGESLFVKLSELIQELPKPLLAILTQKHWAFGNVYRPVISLIQGKYSICYNRITMESYTDLTQDELHILNEFDDLCRKLTFTLSLKANDLIIFRNDLLLHGRTDFPLHAHRVLKRVRLYSKN